MMTIKTLFAATLLATLFVRPTLAVEYVFESLDFPGAVETEAEDINNDGMVVGSYIDADDVSHGFIWQTGEYSSPETGLEEVYFGGVSNSGVIVGSGFDESTFAAPSFTLAGDELITFEYPGASATFAEGINSTGDIVGVFLGDFDEDFLFRSFRKQGDVYDELNFPGFVETSAVDINDQGTIVGIVANDAFELSGFILEDDVYSVFNHPDGETELLAVNNVGTLAGSVYDGNGSRSFVFDGENFDDVSFPGAEETVIWGINDQGALVGAYLLPGFDAFRGFIATPVPEPTGWTMVCLGLSSLLLFTQPRCCRNRRRPERAVRCSGSATK